MGNYYRISTKLNPGIVIDMKMQSSPSAGLQAYPVNIPETNNQLWEFVPDPAGSGYHFIKSKLGLYVIDVKGGSAKSSGSPLQVHLQNPPGFSDNQLWEFVPDPAGSGYTFIKSKLGNYAIDIKGASVAPRTPLQVFPRNSSSQTDNQLWNCSPGQGSIFNPKIMFLSDLPPNIKVSGNGFVPLTRISLWYTFADPVNGTNFSTGQDPVIAPSTVLGEFEYSIPTGESGAHNGSTLEITAADGTNKMTVKASFDAELKAWNTA